MLNSAIISAYGTTEAGYGDTLSYVVAVKNTGTEAGDFGVLIWFKENAAQTITYGEPKPLGAGLSSFWELSLAMPSYDIDVWGASFHWDEGSEEWILDDSKLITRVILTDAAPLADMLEWRGPGQAQEGDQVGFAVTLANRGAIAGWIRPELNWTENGVAKRTTTSEAWLEPGAGQTFDVLFTMPGQTIEVFLLSQHWSYSAEKWITDSIYGPKTVTFGGPPIDGPPDPKLVSFTIDNEVLPGNQVRAIAGLRNEGGTWAFCRPLLWWRLGGQDYEAAPDNEGIEPGESRIFDIYFTMPDVTIQVMAVAQWWDFDARIWWASDEKGPFTVEVMADPWPHLTIPATIATFLGFFNWPKGSWEPVDIPLIDIPPEDIMIGDWVLAGLQFPVDWINWTIQKAKEVWYLASNAWETAIEAWNNADSALEGLLAVTVGSVGSFFDTIWPNLWASIVDMVNDVVLWTQHTIRWVSDRLAALEDLDLSFDSILAFVAEHLGGIEPFKTLFDTFNSVYEFMADVGDEAWSFFSNPADWIFSKLESWFDEPVS